MNFYRSEDVDLYNLIMPKESSYDILNVLGQLNCIHFIDAHPEEPIPQRLFYNYFKRASEALNKLSEIEK